MSNKQHERFLNVAKAVSYTSDFSKHKIGCVIVHKGSVVSVASNSEKTHPLQKKYNKYRDIEDANIKDKTHAEISALSKIKYLTIDFSRVIIYIYREHKNEVKALAKPCKACMQAIIDFGIKTIVYSTENGYSIEVIE